MKSLTKLLTTGILATGLALSQGCSKKEQQTITLEKTKQEHHEKQNPVQPKSIDNFFATKKLEATITQDSVEKEDYNLDLGEGVYMRFKKIPSGNLIVGDLTLPVETFYIAETEVTHRQLARLTEIWLDPYYLNGEKPTLEQEISQIKGGLRETANQRFKSYQTDQRDDIPASLEDGLIIHDLTRALSKKFNLKITLPTVTQLFYVLSEGNFDNIERTIKAKANIGGQRVMPVKSFKPNKFGVYDIVGNLEEMLLLFKYPNDNNLQEYIVGGSYRTRNPSEAMLLKPTDYKRPVPEITGFRPVILLNESPTHVFDFSYYHENPDLIQRILEVNSAFK